MNASPPARRVLLTTLGSLGDLHPYLAIARTLGERGHEPLLATSPVYRERVEAEGVRFHPIRPDLSPLFERPGERMARYMDATKGAERVARELVMPYLEETYHDLLEVAGDMDLVVAHPLTFTARMAAEVARKPWIATVLAPFSFLSTSDPPVPPGMAWFEALRGLGPGFHRRFFEFGRRFSAPWFAEAFALRQRLGLPDAGHPIFDAFSPLANLGLFSPVLGPPQADWPSHCRATGFCFLDHPRADALPEPVARFLAAGEPPLVFTLGSSAVHAARDFYRAAVRHSRSLGRRALLLTGRDTGNTVDATGPDLCVADYAPYARVFPHAAAIVHQGGAGTTGEALRSGHPMLVLPFSHDQFDNAARVRRIGSGDTLDRRRWSGPAGLAALGRLLESRPLAASAAGNGARVRAEDGRAAAATAMLAAIERAKTAEFAPALLDRLGNEA